MVDRRLDQLAMLVDVDRRRLARRADDDDSRRAVARVEIDQRARARGRSSAPPGCIGVTIATRLPESMKYGVEKARFYPIPPRPRDSLPVAFRGFALEARSSRFTAAGAAPVSTRAIAARRCTIAGRTPPTPTLLERDDRQAAPRATSSNSSCRSRNVGVRRSPERFVARPRRSRTAARHRRPARRRWARTAADAGSSSRRLRRTFRPRKAMARLEVGDAASRRRRRRAARPAHRRRGRRPPRARRAPRTGARGARAPQRRRAPARRAATRCAKRAIHADGRTS